ncbi:MAG: orotidine-5'-phosphate decarboxylase [Corynebacterium sp.]|nr:orotidine-5'-phosphate decarboxylase [Corynebacterium sp.]
MAFAKALTKQAKTRGRLCAGIDPHPGLLDAWGVDLATFSKICVEAFADTVALVKPQVAFYEAHGSKGYAILEETIQGLKEGGALVLADAKRGDIGSTMAGYADAWLDPSSPLAVDAVTVSPYLGFHSLDPVLNKANEHGKGVYVLAATSNPEGASVQKATTQKGITLAQDMVNQAGEFNKEHADESGFGPVGVVIGATLTDAPDLTNLNGPVLLPGVGAQGATMEDVARLTVGVEAVSFPNISRAILSQGPDVEALRAAVAEAVQQIGD